MKWRKKNNAYVLLMVMLLVSSLALLVVSFSVSIYMARGLTKTFEKKHEIEKDVATAVNVMQATLNGAFIEEECKEGEKKEESEESKGKDEKKDEMKKKFLLWKKLRNILNKEHTYKEEGKTISFSVTCEEGKLPLKKMFDRIEAIKNKKKESSKEKNSEVDAAEKKDNAQEDSGEKEIEHDEFFKQSNVFFKQLSEKNNALRMVVKEGAHGEGKDESKETEEKKEHPIIVAVKQYEKKGEGRPYNLCIFSPEINRTFYQKRKKEDRDKKQQLKENIISPYCDSCSCWYITPELLTLLVSFVSSEESERKLIKKAEELLLQYTEGPEESDAITSLITTLYQQEDASEKKNEAPSKEGPLNNAVIKDFFTKDPTPKHFTATFTIEREGQATQGMVLLEKIASSDKTDNICVVKQLYIL